MLYEVTKHNLEDHLYSRLHEFLDCYGNGLIPPQLDAVNMHNVLDVACGLGEWILDMAFKHPGTEFVGLDNDTARLDYARAYARVQGIEHVQFMLGDMLRVPFNDNSYDLVHGRFLLATVTATVRQALLNELVRVCEPGGYILLQEALYPVTNSTACTLWSDLYRLALERAEIAPFAVEGAERQLYLSSCRAVQRIDTSIIISYGTDAHRALCTHASEILNFSAPFLIYNDIMNSEQLNKICMQIQVDLVRRDFEGEWPMAVFIGEK